MLAGHIALPDNSFDLTNKSGVYSLYEHYQNVNNIALKSYPITSMYEDFKTNNLSKYPYSYSNNLSVFNIKPNDIYAAGLEGNSLINAFLQFEIYPLVPLFFSFYLYLPNDIDLAASYEIYIDNILHQYTSHPIIQDAYLNNYKFINNIVQENNSILTVKPNNETYTIKILFKNNFLNERLLVTNISLSQYLFS